MNNKKSRFEEGLDEIKLRFGEDGEKYFDAIEAVSEYFKKVNIEFAFGDLYGKEKVIDRPTSELATIAALTVLGFAEKQLRLHIEAALRVGATEAQIIEIITQMISYGGFPAATNALITAKEVFEVYRSKNR